MAIKGTQAKSEVAKIILDTFGNKAFLYNDGKEIRINCTEAGELVQIKVALTAAKVAVEQGADSAIPGIIKATASVIPKSEMIDFEAAETQPQAAPIEPSADEKARIRELMAKLGL